ncbi:sugar phosphate isomerase/epimerase family protein [Pedobacter sp. SAFR-022]|uniref:sugar phosphate isomerase/epimerase family protein n=1 Tax=Pedobacter sp. SAFR-022 TaxID=3436861 RepID=UPI003F7D82D2
MTNRRSFLKTSALLTAGILAAPNLYAFDKKYVGLQLFTIREAMAKDPKAALAKVASLGYNAVEGATYTGTQLFYNMSGVEYAKTLKDNGLISPSSHYMLGESMDAKGTITNGWEKAVDDAAAIGTKYMVCAYLLDPERGNLDHYKATAEKFNKAAEVCKKAGIQFCYHNHDFEFEAQNGKYPFDVLLENTDKDLVKFELDLYWASRANQDPIKLFNRYPGRFPLWHVKDMDKSTAKNITEVGNGSIDFKRIFAQSKKAGLDYFFVEQDICPGDPFDSISQSISYLKKNLI